MKFRKVIPKKTSERETTILISDWVHHAQIFSAHPYVIKQLDKVVEENKSARITHVNLDGSKMYDIDKRHISINPKAYSPRKEK